MAFKTVVGKSWSHNILRNQLKEADPSTRVRTPDSAAYLASASATLSPSRTTVSTVLLPKRRRKGRKTSCARALRSCENISTTPAAILSTGTLSPVGVGTKARGGMTWTSATRPGAAAAHLAARRLARPSPRTATATARGSPEDAMPRGAAAARTNLLLERRRRRVEPLGGSGGGGGVNEPIKSASQQPLGLGSAGIGGVA